MLETFSTSPGQAIPVTEAVIYCTCLADRAGAVAAARASAAAADADRRAQNLTPVQMQQLSQAERGYDAAGAHAERAVSELRALKEKFSLAESAYRAFKEPAA